MRGPRISIAGLLMLTGCVAVVFGVLSQPWEHSRGALLTIALVAMPCAAVLIRFGADRWRVTARSIFAGTLALARHLLTLAAAGLVIVAGAAILGVNASRPIDPAVILALAVTLVALVASGRRAWSGRGPDRAFAWGFTLFGWPYWLLGLAPALGADVPMLLSADALHRLYPHVYLVGYPEPVPPVPTLRPSLGAPWAYPFYKPPAVPRDYLRFQRVGHCLVTLAVAVAGGLAARALADRPRALEEVGVPSLAASRGPAPQPGR